MPRSFPPGRIGLATLLADAAISKNTFFLRYRHEPEFVRLLDIQEDRDHRLHFPADAGHRLRELRGKSAHGNSGRTPKRFCPSCGATLHPRHSACFRCGRVLLDTASSSVEKTRRSTAQSNFLRAQRLRELREQI